MCTCEHAKVEAALALIKAGEVKSLRKSGSGPILSKVDDSYICTVDSFGFRSELPGECEVCYSAYKQKYASAFALGEDD
jgi:hypothetical protein